MYLGAVHKVRTQNFRNCDPRTCTFHDAPLAYVRRQPPSLPRISIII